MTTWAGQRRADRRWASREKGQIKERDGGKREKKKRKKEKKKKGMREKGFGFVRV